MRRSNALLVALFAFFCCFASRPATASAAEIRSRNDAGLGYTSNANLEKDNTDADSFYRLSSSNSMDMEPYVLRFRLGYKGYSTQRSNDLLSWRTEAAWEGDSNRNSGWNLTGGVSGRHYVHGAPETTDNSFSDVGLDFVAEHFNQLTESTELTYEAGYELSKYLSAEGRMDHAFTLGGGAEHTWDSGWELGGRATLGLVPSNISDYSRTYLESGVDARLPFRKVWALEGELSFRHTWFRDRVISEETTVTRKRGAARMASIASVVQDKETYDALTAGMGISYLIGASFVLSAEVNHTRQVSKSGLQDYSVNELISRMTLRL